MKSSPKVPIANRQYSWKIRIKNWLPVCAWAGLIFFFSSDYFSSANTAQIFGSLLSWLAPEVPTEDIAPVHGAMRKIGHWGEYFILAVLTLRALRAETGKAWEWRHAVCVLLFIFFYAVSDEFHQIFVPSRTASFVDVMIDVLGGICGVFWMYWYGRGACAPIVSRVQEH